MFLCTSKPRDAQRETRRTRDEAENNTTPTYRGRLFWCFQLSQFKFPLLTTVIANLLLSSVLPGCPQSTNVILNAFDAKSAKDYEQFLRVCTRDLKCWLGFARANIGDSDHYRASSTSITPRRTANQSRTHPNIQNRSYRSFKKKRQNFPKGC